METDQLCSHQKIEVKNWKNVKKITPRSAVKRYNLTTGKLCCVNANWAAITEGVDTLDIMLNVLYFVTIIHVAQRNLSESYRHDMHYKSFKNEH